MLKKNKTKQTCVSWAYCWLNTCVSSFPIIVPNFVYFPLMINLNQGGTKYIEMCLKKMMMLLMYSYVSLPDRAFYVRWKVEISSSHLREKWLWWLWRRKMLLIMGKTIVVNKIDSPPLLPRPDPVHRLEGRRSSTLQPWIGFIMVEANYQNGKVQTRKIKKTLTRCTSH